MPVPGVVCGAAGPDGAFLSLSLSLSLVSAGPDGVVAGDVCAAEGARQMLGLLAGPDEGVDATSVAWLGMPRYCPRGAGRGLGACGPLRERSVWVRVGKVAEGLDGKVCSERGWRG